MDHSNAACTGQLLNTVMRAVGVELKVREQQDLIERLEELESLWERKHEERRMGLRDRLRILQRATERHTIAIRQRGGTTVRFYAEEVWPERFMHESERGGRGTLTERTPDRLTRLWRPYAMPHPER